MVLKFYCTAGRGTEKFVKTEIEKSLLAENIIVTDGKVYFESPISDLPRISTLKSVERVFVAIFKSDWTALGGSTQRHLKRAIVIKELWEHEDIQTVLTTLHSERCATVDNKSVHEGDVQNFSEKHQNDNCVFEGDEQNVCKKDDEPPMNKKRKVVTPLSFRVTCRCTGRIGRKLNPLNLQKDLGVGMKQILDWKVDLRSPDIEINVQANDQGLVVGIPLTRIPVSKRSYIQHFGLRSTIAYIMSSLLPIKAGDSVLDPMCGKATILVESAYYNQAITYIGCDKDTNQLKLAKDNIKFAKIDNLHLIQGNSKELPLQDNCIDHIVCDAPFGNKFVVDQDIKEFYREFLHECIRVLKPGGKIVLLTSPDMESYLSQSSAKGHNSAKSCKISSHCDTTETQKYCNHDNMIDTDQNTHQSSIDSKETISANSTLFQNVHSEVNSKEQNLTDIKSASYDEESAIQHIDSFIFIESHYVKLGETHAYICVFIKPSK